jgi:transcriptional regulator with XRE-family HTH domain
MIKEIADLRKVLSVNIKKQRAVLGLSQEKLAERAGISANMINDIEGGRTWVSDKTLIRLGGALDTEIYKLLLPISTPEEKEREIISELQRIKRSFDNKFDNALKSHGFY